MNNLKTQLIDGLLKSIETKEDSFIFMVVQFRNNQVYGVAHLGTHFDCTEYMTNVLTRNPIFDPDCHDNFRGDFYAIVKTEEIYET